MREDVERLVAAVTEGPKYRAVSRDLVEHVVAALVDMPITFERKIKLARSKIHQVAGAYLGPAPRYDRWLATIEAAARAGDRAVLVSACREAMRGHASTRERLPFLRELYLAAIPDWSEIRTVVDVGCGLNPLFLAELDSRPDLEYFAYDVLGDLVAFLNGVFPLLGVGGRADVCDVTRDPACLKRPADLAIMLKLLPVLDQIEAGAGERLFDAVDADRLLISFPLQTLGGNRKGFGRTYETRFLEIAEQRSWSLLRFSFANELVFLVTRG